MSFKPAGLATGIGSVPFTNADQALALIFKIMPEIPHWPQMPGRGQMEGFVFQSLNPLVKTGLIKIEGGRAFFDDGDNLWPERLAEFYTVYMAAAGGDKQAIDFFAVPEEAAAGLFAFVEYIEKRGPGEAMFFKGHLAGPLTIGFQLKDTGGRLAYYEDQLRDLVVKTLAVNARWQAARLSELGRKAIIFVDEPGISVYGKSDYITVTSEMIEKDLNEIFEQIHLAGALAGVHSCDAIDWSILYRCGLDIVNLDVYNFGESLIPFAAELKGFIERGGVLAQGIVPTNDNARLEDRGSLLARLEKLWESLGRRGIRREDLLASTMITPACGTGLLERDLAERIYRLAGEVSMAVRERAVV
ncbi:MAG: hypothetical protein ACOY31_12570 [Bacillota bacterium]